MTAAEQRELAQRLKAALDHAGIRVTKGIYRGGNLTRWDDVAPELLLGLWMRMAYRIEVVEQPTQPAQSTPDIALAGAALLTLVRGDA